MTNTNNMKETARDPDTNKDCKKCYENRDWLLKYSPTVTFLVQQILILQKKQQQTILNRDKLNNGNKKKKDNSILTNKIIPFDESKIICDSCDEMKSGGFHPELGILLCKNRLMSRWHMEDTLSHELIHWYDNLKWSVDWLNLKQHACSEIRASSLSGECRFWQEFKRQGFKVPINRGHQQCVRRRALISLQGNPNCKDKQMASRIIDEVWDTCFKDTRPFDEIYR